MILKCSCPDNTPAARYQSGRYGPGLRVFNAQGPKTGQAACTCCQARVPVPQVDHLGVKVPEYRPTKGGQS